jgi:raffinose/stachyose/melibiose transport system permease protein
MLEKGAPERDRRRGLPTRALLTRGDPSVSHSSARPAGREQGGPRRVTLLWVLPALAFALAIHYIAVGAGAWYSFTDWNGLGSPRWIGLGNFREISHDPAARGALEHTVMLAFTSVVAANAIGLVLALALHRTLKSRHFIRALFFAPWVMSPLAVSFIWQYIFDYRGPLNTSLSRVGLGSHQQGWLSEPRWALWTIFVVLVWQFSGLTMVIFLAGLQGIPEELDEACAVDGASTLFRLRKVTIPLLAPALTVTLTLTLINGLRVFDQILAITGGGPVNASETLATQVYKQTFVNGRFGYGAALALILTLLITAIALTQLVFLRARESRI